MVKSAIGTFAYIMTNTCTVRTLSNDLAQVNDDIITCYLIFVAYSVTFGRASVNELEYQPLNVEVRHTASGLPADGSHDHHGNPSLVWALTKSFGGTFIVAGFFKLGQDLLTFASPQILKYVNLVLLHSVV